MSIGVSLREGETPLKAQEPPMITSGSSLCDFTETLTDNNNEIKIKPFRKVGLFKSTLSCTDTNYQATTDKLHCAFISEQDTSTKHLKGKRKDISIS